jgi:hypothetical protein
MLAIFCRQQVPLITTGLHPKSAIARFHDRNRGQSCRKTACVMMAGFDP